MMETFKDVISGDQLVLTSSSSFLQGIVKRVCLCSDKAGFITGENICIDGGMTRQMIYHGDHGWMLTE